jgi:8-oxo-dGTP diphosphatase
VKAGHEAGVADGMAADAQRSLLLDDSFPVDARGPVDVAVAVLVRQDGAVLLARRPRSKVYAGYWEFPGGKVEPGESTPAALHREIQEELSVEVKSAYPWITRVFTYPHATVRLHFFRVTAWQGELQAKEHERLAWQQPDSVNVEPVLPANGPVLRALMLPAEYGITQAGELGVDAFLGRLRSRLDSGLRLVQIREPSLTREALESLSAAIIALARPAGAKVLVNSDIALAHRVGADGVHLTARQLLAAKERPDLLLMGASCHGADELRAAERLGADLAVLGPVKPTPTHAGAQTLGWDGFEAAARGSAIPVYALGGVMPGDLETAWARGAHGVAMIRGAWK